MKLGILGSLVVRLGFWDKIGKEEGTLGFKGIVLVYRLLRMGKKVGIMVLRLDGQVGQL